MMRSIFSGTFAPNSPINPVLSSICSLRAAQVGVYTNHPTYVCTEFQSDVVPNGFSCWSVLVCYLSVPQVSWWKIQACCWTSANFWTQFSPSCSWVEIPTRLIYIQSPLVAEIAKGTRALPKNIHLPSAPPSADWQWHFEWPPTWISTWPPSSTRRSNGMCWIHWLSMGTCKNRSAKSQAATATLAALATFSLAVLFWFSWNLLTTFHADVISCAKQNPRRNHDHWFEDMCRQKKDTTSPAPRLV